MSGSKTIGYILAILGLVIIALSKIITSLPFLAKLGAKATAYTILGAVIFLAIGLVLILSKEKKGKITQVSEEVPIYEGEGKKRKIVGYKKESILK